jgi:preprotein translocase subunit YajC
MLTLLQQGAPQGGWSSPLVMMLLMGGVVYLMMIRPQQKKAREHQDWLKSLKKGDEVVTQGGIIGRISGLTDQLVTLEVQEKVRIRVLRTSISGRPPELRKTVDEKAATPALEEKK